MNNMKFMKLLFKDTRRIIGLTSGMSMDGVDLAYVEISGEFPDLNLKLLGLKSHAYSDEFRQRLLPGQSSSVAEVSRLNVLVAEEFAKAVNEFLVENGIDPATVDAIGSHGQTLFHSTGSADLIPSSLQIGSPSIIAELTGITTIGNFRVRDVAAGGLGAPLVSLADYVLFRDPSESVVLHTLGGISNVTVVGSELSDIVAFDTGPANIAIDHFCRRIPGNQGVDDSGSVSGAGVVIEEFLKDLRTNPYFQRQPPKSAGFQDFGAEWLDEVSRPYADRTPQDLVRTAVEFAATTIADAYEQHLVPRFPNLTKIIFSGGGIYNQTLMRRLGQLLPKFTIDTLQDDLSDSKEAIAFALLANETLSGRPGNLVAVTGARRAVVLGEIAY